MKAGSAFEEHRIIGDDGSPFTGSDGFVQLQAINSDVPDGSEWAALVAGPDALCAIFQHSQPVLVSQRHDSIHLAGISLKVGDHDHFRLRSDLDFNIRRINIE